MAEEVWRSDDFSAGLRREIGALKGKATEIAKALGGAREKAKEAAPRFVIAFGKIKDEANVKSGGTRSFGVADFARLFDPKVPTHAADKEGEVGYRNHPMYYGINYMLTLNRNKNRAGRQGTRDVARDQPARLIATILQVAKDPAVVWAAVSREFGLSPRLLTMWQNRVAAAKPLIDFSSVLKPVAVDESKIVHMVPASRPATQPMSDASPADIRAALEQTAGAVGVRGRRRAATPAATAAA